jgi:facilitated trehalose transporter
MPPLHPSIPQDDSMASANLLVFCAASVHSVGATLACLVAGAAMASFGRRGATLLCTAPAYLLGYLIMASANSLEQIVIGRFFTGIGLGFTLTVPNVYIVEVTSPEVRGWLGVLPNLFC